MAKPPDDKNGSLGFEDKLWAAADVLRNNMDPAEYKHVVLGLVFLKYISDAFEERRAQLIADGDADAVEDRDEYTAENVFWVPPIGRWSHIRGLATQPTIGKVLDDAMDAVEADNPVLKGALPKAFALPALDKQKLGELINLISSIGLGTAAHREKDTLGRVYEYFLSRFASAEGRGGGEFYTPSSIVRVLVEMLEPYQGRVYDPACGSGGMFVQSVKFIDAHGGRRDAVTVYGQESNPTTWRMARMNMAIRGIEAKCPVSSNSPDPIPVETTGRKGGMAPEAVSQPGSAKALRAHGRSKLWRPEMMAGFVRKRWRLWECDAAGWTPQERVAEDGVGG